MSYALYRPKLLVRDIENFSKKNSYLEGKKENKFASLLKQIAKAIGKIVEVNIQLNQASKLLDVAIKTQYKVYKQLSDREKDDFLIKWEGFARTLNDHSKNLSVKPSNFIARRITEKSLHLVSEVNAFVSKINDELYPHLNKPYSQEELKELAKKFQHLPKEMLEEIASEDNFEAA